MFNIFYIITLHYFFLRTPKIADFVRMSKFDQNYEFSWNMWSPFGEKCVLYTYKTLAVNSCTWKFPEENIVFA